MRVSVVGAGVVGLSVAIELATAGHRVVVVADQEASDTVSGVAGAIWFPYAIDSSTGTLGQLEAGLERFNALARQAGTGVEPRTGLLIERRVDADRAWMQVIRDHPEAAPDVLPPGATAGFRLTLPLIDTPRYLSWLAAEARNRGIRRVPGTVRELGSLAAGCDLVVVAAGLRSPALVGDDTVTHPIRGQVVRLANPGLRDWIVDDDNPAGMAYVLPRSLDIVCGGTADVGVDAANLEALTVDPVVEEAILDRCIALVPQLAGLPVLSRAVGLRPGRPTVRVEVLDRWPVPVITCYGHGGAGVTASWGSAIAVCDLIAAL